LPWLAGVVERVAKAALHLKPVVDHALDGYFVLGALHGDAAGSGVDAAGILAHHDVVDISGPLVLERSIHAGIELARAAG
jgi:hypothetical protein